MVIVYQVILLIIIITSFIFALGSSDNKEMAGNATLLCTVSIVSYVVSVMWA